MKKSIYILAAIFLLSSCKSVQKMVDRGDYDEAIYFATDKLYGKKNKKTKYVKGLETGFNKVIDRDLDRIESLNPTERPEHWDRVYDILLNMQARQDKVSSLLPLVSTDGYVAHFNFMDINEKLAEASSQAAEYHYQVSLSLLDRAESKEDARHAYYTLDKIDRYFKHYKDKESLKARAHEQGMTHIMVAYTNTKSAIIEDHHLQIGDFWTRFYLDESAPVTMDYKVLLAVTNVDVGSERERENNFFESKQVKDGFNYEYDDNGNVRKDTLGNDIKTDRFIEVRSQVTEIFREKTAIATAFISLHDLKSNSLLKESPLTTEVIFESDACSFSGDERALSGNIRKRIGRRLLPFPTDYDMLWDAELRLQESFLDYLNEMQII